MREEARCSSCSLSWFLGVDGFLFESFETIVGSFVLDQVQELVGEKFELEDVGFWNLLVLSVLLRIRNTAVSRKILKRGVAYKKQERSSMMSIHKVAKGSLLN
ncbi:unnamed protein product [Victoria cruziana]